MAGVGAGVWVDGLLVTVDAVVGELVPVCGSPVGAVPVGPLPRVLHDKIVPIKSTNHTERCNLPVLIPLLLGSKICLANLSIRCTFRSLNLEVHPILYGSAIIDILEESGPPRFNPGNKSPEPARPQSIPPDDIRYAGCVEGSAAGPDTPSRRLAPPISGLLFTIYYSLFTIPFPLPQTAISAFKPNTLQLKQG